jgi:hypothetical protein
LKGTRNGTTTDEPERREPIGSNGTAGWEAAADLLGINEQQVKRLMCC